MNTFESNIQKWVSIDNQLKTLADNVKRLREERMNVSDRIFEYVREKKIEKTSISISDGKLRFANTRVQQPLTFQYVEHSLREIIPNDAQVKQIMHHLKANRKEKFVNEIKRI
jgi:hypothetical protein